ncbi:ABC transporter permease [Spiroplasma alleghenense]|uniref:ABC transporter permease n=1 Tax=Spiroplasma alleghenense TaxID=216931 RepID=A0A345Z3W0_9MOLU|nr:ABC transporter permease [Spiroplasma alleghenense]AXK51289.1 hypothetical protein SALLE_v1c06170 [Spiroplasma alleghenense]
MKQNLKTIMILYRLQWKNWLKGYINLSLGIGVTILTLLIWLSFKQDDPFLLISAIAVGIARNSISTFLRTISDWRTKGFSERLDNTPISNSIKFFAIFSFNLFNCIFVTILVFGIGQAFFPEQRAYLSEINWAMLSTGLFLVWLISILLSYVIFIAFKNQQVMMAIATLLYFFITYLLGLGFPYHLIIQYQWLKVILYFIPHRYMINVLQAAWVNAPNMKYDFYSGSELKWSVDFGFGGQLWIPYFVTILMIIIFTLIILLNFIYKNRFHKIEGAGFSAFKAKSLKYIDEIKNISDIQTLEAISKTRDLEVRFYRVKQRAENYKFKIYIDNKDKNRNNKKE